jgi:pyruvate kinase
MDVARLNFSYGTHAQHAASIARVRAAARQVGRPVAVLQDLSGPKLRVGEIHASEVELRAGEQVVLSVSRPPSAGLIPLPFPSLARLLSAGQRVLLSDGRIELEVLAASGTEIACRVRVGGVLRSHQGVNLPDLTLPIRAVTAKDLADLDFGLRHQVDWVAMSFVRRAEDLAPLRRRISLAGDATGIIAKIEKHEAIGALDEIVAAADGVMVARGDLGVELPLDQVPVLQRQILAQCRQAGKPVIVATQMLESMVTSPRPTRAEVSDVANAVFGGADAVMLSAETAAGRYPVESVRVMARVAARAEAAFDFGAALAESAGWPCRTVTDAIAEATCSLARDLDARAIVTATSTGHTALMVAMHRPAQPIVAVSANVATWRRLALVWGVSPLLAPRGRNTDELILNAVGHAQQAGLVRKGDRVVVTAGVPAGIAGKTNLVKVEVVGQHFRF